MSRAREVFAVLAFALALPGCGTMVVGGGAGGSDPGETSDPGESISSEPNAVAMRWSEWTPPQPGGSSFFNFELGGQTPDPNALVIFYGNKPLACAEPFLDVTDPMACDHFWQVILIIPPDRATPGEIDLSDQSIAEYRSVWEAGCAGGGSGSGPGIIQGKLTISSLDATQVVTTLALEPSTGWEGQSGDYTAAFCP